MLVLADQFAELRLMLFFFVSVLSSLEDSCPIATFWRSYGDGTFNRLNGRSVRRSFQQRTQRLAQLVTHVSESRKKRVSVLCVDLLSHTSEWASRSKSAVCAL